MPFDQLEKWYELTGRRPAAEDEEYINPELLGPSTRAPLESADANNLRNLYTAQADILGKKKLEAQKSYEDALENRNKLVQPKSSEFDQILGAMLPLAVAAIGGESAALSMPKAFEGIRGSLKEQEAKQREDYKEKQKNLDLKLAAAEKNKNAYESAQNKLAFEGNVAGLKQDLKMKQEQVQAGKQQEKDRKSNMNVASELRKEYQSRPQVKNFDEIESSFNKIETFKNDPSGAGDIGLIFSYMKILDPTSTVREGEYATASNAGGVPDKVRGVFNKLIDGRFLSPEQRKDFADQAGKMFNAQLNIVNQERQNYISLAEQYGVDPALVISRKSIEKKQTGSQSLDEKRKKLMMLRSQGKQNE